MINSTSTSAPIRLGISSCLLGERVRYDGAHKLDRDIVQDLGRHVEFVPVCPEVAIGLGVPRPPIRLVGAGARPRARVLDDTARDVTGALATFGARRARALRDISGYILKSRSPSCGLTRVKLYPKTGGRAARHGRGIYAAALGAARPLLPLEEDERLADAAARDNFIERVFAYHCWQQLLSGGISRPRLEAFHAAHELTLMAHGADAALGRLLARAPYDVRATARVYIERFMRVLTRPATRRRHAAALAYASRRITATLSPRDRAEIADVLVRYRRGTISLAAAVVRLRRYPDAWSARQTYLYPDPREFALRHRA